MISKVTAGIEKAKADIISVIDDHQPFQSNRINQGFFSEVLRGRLTGLVWNHNLPWRQFSLYTVWTAFKVVGISRSAEDRQDDLEDVAIGLLGLSFLSADPAPGEALIILRAATLVSLTDCVNKVVIRSTHSEQEYKLVRTFCSICRINLVAAMSFWIINKILAEHVNS